MQSAGMTGVITSDCKVPYLDASVYMIILGWFLSVETTLNHLSQLLLKNQRACLE